jgi:hypothetical protein
MANRSSVLITVASRDNRELPLTQATIIRVDWDKPERTKNALKTFGFLFTLSFVSIFIPILHFILVPTLFIGSFVFAMDKFQETTRNEGGSGECPKCHQKFVVQPSKWVMRFTHNCNLCHEDLEMKIPI